jgi:FlaA1/EpsC-like NDP-sugar epimerase
LPVPNKDNYLYQLPKIKSLLPLPEKHIHPALVFLFDLLICACSVVLAYLLRFNFNIPKADLLDLPYVVNYILLVRALSFMVGKTYQAIIRFTSTRDAFKLFTVCFGGSAFMAVTNIVTFSLAYKFFIPFSIIIIDFIVSVFLLVSIRTLIKVLYFEMINPSREKTPVIIYGAGEAGLITKRTLDKDVGNKYKPIAFLENDKNLVGKKIEGIKIHPLNYLKNLLRENKVGFFILSRQDLETSEKQNIIDACFEHKVRVLNVPPANRWINGELSFKQIKKINIEDLIQRDEIDLDKASIEKQIKNKVIMVTGAAGSIGSELVRQIIKFAPASVILVDQAESALYELDLELKEKVGKNILLPIIADICNESRIQSIFTHYKPNLVFHAAAYKHVPLMEENPCEAVRTNILGTKILAEIAAKNGVEEFVMISSDKAVNPTGVMGATKRAAEIFVQALGFVTKTKFITTRFGNVLGSNGSVIPVFRKQIENGGPVTVTHADVTRYFMSIPEAAQLVLEAGAMGKGGEVFLFDMGEPIKVYDLAVRMINLHGLTLDKDIKIVFSGLRPGEKLFEELLYDTENSLPTHNARIMIGKVNTLDFEKVKDFIENLKLACTEQNDKHAVQIMKQMIPEFISKNSVYSALDKK